NCCAVEADLAAAVAAAAGNCYLAVLSSSMILANCSGISRCLAEVQGLLHCEHDMAMAAESLKQADVAGNYWRMVVVVVDLAASALLRLSFRAWPVDDGDTGHDRKDLAPADSHDEELVGDKELDS